MTKKICFDRIIKDDLRRAIPFASLGIGDRTRALAPVGKRWPVGATLRVSFLAGTSEQQDFVRQHSVLWTRHANLKFEFISTGQGDVRVTFDENDGAWSYIGIDAKTIPKNEATLNLGWLDEGVVLHEFGHAIGLAHEHQNPAGGIRWNEAEVIKDLKGPPNSWTEETIRHNVLNKYKHDQVNGTVFDPKSIMLYSFPKEWTLNGFHTEPNEMLSAVDKAFIASQVMYPGLANVEDFREIPVFEPTLAAAEIRTPGEEDRYKFRVTKPGSYVIETRGSTDVIVKLFGPDSPSQLIAEDDDGGQGSNSKISVDLSQGNYFIQVRHYDRTKGTGAYGISVVKT